MTKKEDEERRRISREYMRRKRAEPDFRERERETFAHRAKKIREWFKDYKKILKCEKCGDGRDYVLEFHHKDSEQKFKNISGLVGKSYSKETILNELKKCDVLCSNCHKELHHFEKKEGEK
jgi:hypothetical protein